MSELLKMNSAIIILGSKGLLTMTIQLNVFQSCFIFEVPPVCVANISHDALPRTVPTLMGADESNPSSSQTSEVDISPETMGRMEYATNFIVPGEGPYLGFLLDESTF